jgi:hypothetical protein
MPKHPFSWLPTKVYKRVLIGLLIGFAVVLAALSILDCELKNEKAPCGIISFELAGDLVTARSILCSWGTKGQLHAAISLGLDFAFIPLYAGLVALACAMTAARWETCKYLFPLGLTLAWAQLVAALLDVVENIALIRLLLGAGGELWPQLARYCAIPKLAIFIAGLLFAVAAGLAGWRRNQEGSGDTPPTC